MSAMSARVGLFPHLHLHFRTRLPHRSFHYLPPSSPSRSIPRPSAFAVTRTASRPTSSSKSYLYALGLGVAAFSLLPRGTAHCAPTLPVNSPAAANRPPQTSAGGPGSGAPAESVLNVYQLGFGATCGICAGVFVKKGLKAIAFVLGGAFVLLQYLSSKSYITVDWSRFSSRYDRAFGTKTPSGEIKYPTIGGIFNGIIDFLSANFQQRATFVAGFVLGLRVG